MHAKRYSLLLLASLCALALLTSGCSMITIRNVAISNDYRVVVNRPGGKTIQAMFIQHGEDSKTILNSLGGNYSVSIKSDATYESVVKNHRQQLDAVHNNASLTSEEKQTRLTQIVSNINSEFGKIPATASCSGFVAFFGSVRVTLGDTTAECETVRDSPLTKFFGE